MSSILEALKKLEDEKAARRGGIGNIAGKVSSAGRRTGKKPAWTMPAAMAAVAVAAILATYAAMEWLSPRRVLPAAPKATAPSPPAPQGGAPAAPNDAAAKPAVAVLPPRDVVVEKPAASGKGPTVPSAATVPAPKQAALRPSATAREKVAPPQPAAKSGLPALTITGIAWQEQSASRLAVVNDIPVTEGSIIEGARVKEIFHDHLRFSIQGKDIDVYMEKDPA